MRLPFLVGFIFCLNPCCNGITERQFILLILRETYYLYHCIEMATDLFDSEALAIFTSTFFANGIKFFYQLPAFRTIKFCYVLFLSYLSLFIFSQMFCFAIRFRSLANFTSSASRSFGCKNSKISQIIQTNIQEKKICEKNDDMTDICRIA